MAQHPQVALAALVHGIAQTVLQGSYYGHDLPLGVKLNQQDRREGMVPDWPESPAAVALRELQQMVGEALPQDSAELAQAVGLDMAAWWKPTADGYFHHVPKAAILEAVGEFAPEHVTRHTAC